MARYLCLICLSATYLQTSYQKSTPDSPTYRGAVVEFFPSFKLNDSTSTLQRNVDSYVEFIQEASRKDADIIVFPEDGLTAIHLPARAHMDPWTTLIPAPSEDYVPCDKDTIPVSKALKDISCAAKEGQIYVVINIAEKYQCNADGCPDNKALYYNSNVVFDRAGKIIARYRKTHLFYEEMFNTTAKPEVTIFDTDFGVKFGTFICFDILFREPALTLSRKHGITDFVYSTAWFSEVPFLTAVQTQMGWAFAENSTLLAAGYNNPAAGNAGSGIYIGQEGIGRAVLPKTSGSTMLIFDIPKSRDSNVGGRRVEETGEEKARFTNLPEHRVHDELRRKRDSEVEGISLLHDDVSKFVTEAVNSSTRRTLCHEKFCCEFNIEMESVDPSVTYRLVSFKGTRNYGPVMSAGVAVCAVIQCANDSALSCGSTLPSDTRFNLIDISGKFDNYPDSLVMPTTLNSLLMPLANFGYQVKRQEDHARVRMFLRGTTNDTLTFGIYARDFTKDNEPNGTASLVAHLLTVFALSLSLSL